MRHIRSFIEAFGDENYKSIVEYLQANGATSDNENQAWREFLNLNGFTQDHLEDAYKQWLISLTSGSEYILDMEKFIGENPSILAQDIIAQYFVQSKVNIQGTTVIDHSVPSDRHLARQGVYHTLNGSQAGLADFFDMWQGGARTALTVIQNANVTSNSGHLVGMYDTNGDRIFRLSRASGYLQLSVSSDGGTGGLRIERTDALVTGQHDYILRMNGSTFKLGVDDNYDVAKTVDVTYNATVSELHDGEAPLSFGAYTTNDVAAADYLTGSQGLTLLAPRYLADWEIDMYRYCGWIPPNVVLAHLEEESGTTSYVWTNINGLSTNNITWSGGTWTANNNQRVSMFNQHGGTITGGVVIPNTIDNVDAAGGTTEFQGKAKQNLTSENDLGTDYAGGFDASTGEIYFAGSPEKIQMLANLGEADGVTYAEMSAITGNSYVSFTDADSEITDLKIYCDPQFAEFEAFKSGEANAEGTDDRDVINHITGGVLSQALDATPASTDTLFLKGMQIDLSSLGGSAAYRAGYRLVNPFFKNIVDDDTESNIRVYDRKLTGNALKTVRRDLDYIERNLLLVKNYYVKEGRTLALYIERLAERELDASGIRVTAGQIQDDRITLSGTGTESLTISSNVVSSLSASTTINYVAPLGSVETINVLMIGDSQANQMVAAFFNNLNARANLTAVFHGTQLDSLVPNEAYPGQTAGYFVGASSPFYSGGQLDFSAYATAQSISALDFVTIQLGANDVDQGISPATTIANLKTLINDILSVFPLVKILVCLANKGSNQADFTSDNDEDHRYIQFRRDMNNLHKAMIDDGYFEAGAVTLVDLDLIFNIDVHFANSIHGNSAWNVLASIQLGDAVEGLM